MNEILLRNSGLLHAENVKLNKKKKKKTISQRLCCSSVRNGTLFTGVKARETSSGLLQI